LYITENATHCCIVACALLLNIRKSGNGSRALPSRARPKHTQELSLSPSKPTMGKRSPSRDSSPDGKRRRAERCAKSIVEAFRRCVHAQ
jgi:hypothetical protein